MKVELVKEKEIPLVYDLIENTIKKSFPSFYPPKSIEHVFKNLSVEKLKNRITWTHFYVVKDKKQIVGCGAIGPYWDSQTESCLFNIFVDPDYQKQGIGKKIIQILENDEYFLRASRIEIPASLLAIPFYKKMGYEHKNGELNFDDGHFALEKFNKPIN